MFKSRSFSRMRPAWLALGAALAVACIEFKDEDSSSAHAATSDEPVDVVMVEDISAPLYDVYARDTAGLGQRAAEAAMLEASNSPGADTTAERGPVRLPARIPAQGALTLHIQVLLDRANFSPGILDGAWGRNAALALAFFSSPGASAPPGAASTPASISREAYERLKAAAGPEPILTRYTLTAADVAGPFVTIPDSVYAQAKLKCLCYSSAIEGIAEKFHTSEKLLAQLNPRVDLKKLRAGVQLTVPNVLSGNVASPMDTAEVARLVISRTGYWTQALNSAGEILYHFPSTLGSGYDPSPTGALRITHVSRNPAFHYQPKLFSEVPDTRPDARLPPGPNSPVGVVWISLSRRHYGIHGTSSPETIGYANSHGCVRLTNWDALRLSDLVEAGTPVEFK